MAPQNIDQQIGAIQQAVKGLPQMAQDISEIRAAQSSMKTRLDGLPCNGMMVRVRDLERQAAEGKPMRDLFWKITTAILLAAGAAIAAWANFNGRR